MKQPATFRRGAAATALILAAALMIVSVITQPPFGEGFDSRLAAIDAAGTRATVSVWAFALAQLPFLVAVLGVAHLLRGRAPLLSHLAVLLAAAGALGHAVFAGISLVMLTMAADEANREIFAELLAAGEQGGPSVPFMAMGLLGTVLSLLLLAIALGRAKVGPRWVPWALGAFLLVEFVGSNFSDWAAVGSGVLYALAFGALAVTVVRSSARVWASPLDVVVPELAPAKA